MKLFCVRHGETVYNMAGRIQGQFDSQLSPLGLRQCQAVADALAIEAIDAVIASPLSRAKQSAQVIAEHLRLPVQLDPRLMEINAGIFQGHTWEEIEAKFATEAAEWRTQDPDYRIPQGESRRDVMLRAGAALADLREAGYRAAIVVAHGGSLSAALKYLLEIPAQRNPFSLLNASISTLAWDKDVKLLSLNDVAHLRELVSAGGDL
jgi:broad specificity phosphatase PhoE